jgi:SAM-dependent methyltransferase
VSEEFDESFWEQRWTQVYRDHADAVREMPPNPQLVATAGDLPPGTALDAGCGHAADTLWLASRGWRVTAADVAITALNHARARAETLGPDIAGRSTWTQADLTTWTPAENHFDLVSSHYVHGVGPREELLRRLAAAVVPGGTLLVVGHDPSDPTPDISHGSAPELYVTPDQLAACLDLGHWDIDVADIRTRPATDHHGHHATARDAVLRARKHA